MSWFFLGLLTLAVGLGIAELLVRASPKRLLRLLRWIGVGAAVLVVALFAIGIRNISLGLLLGMAMALLSRSGLFAPRSPFRMGNPSQSSAHKSSQVETPSLRMSLDHESGQLDGEILSGVFEGRRLSDLSFDQLMQFHLECSQGDPDAIALLEAYLDRTAGEDWREAASSSARGGGASGGEMSKADALNILGLSDDASEDDIRAAHRRLMKKLHPDQGGSDFLARQINEAKDLLLSG